MLLSLFTQGMAGGRYYEIKGKTNSQAQITPRKELLEYQIKQLREILESEGLI